MLPMHLIKIGDNFRCPLTGIVWTVIEISPTNEIHVEAIEWNIESIWVDNKQRIFKESNRMSNADKLVYLNKIHKPWWKFWG